jgi:hypothetical protein
MSRSTTVGLIAAVTLTLVLPRLLAAAAVYAEEKEERAVGPPTVS